MKDSLECGIILAICATLGYSMYVILIHGDGTVFAAFIGFLGLIGGWCLGRNKKIKIKKII